MAKLLWQDIAEIFTKIYGREAKIQQLQQYFQTRLLNQLIALHPRQPIQTPYTILKTDAVGDTILHALLKIRALYDFTLLWNSLRDTNPQQFLFHPLINVQDNDGHTILHLMALKFFRPGAFTKDLIKKYADVLKTILSAPDIAAYFDPYLLNHDNKTFVELMDNTQLHELANLLFKHHCCIGVNIGQSLPAPNTISLICGSDLQIDGCADMAIRTHDDLVHLVNSHGFSSQDCARLNLGAKRLSQALTKYFSSPTRRATIFLNAKDLFQIIDALTQHATMMPATLLTQQNTLKQSKYHAEECMSVDAAIQINQQQQQQISLLLAHMNNERQKKNSSLYQAVYKNQNLYFISLLTNFILVLFLSFVLSGDKKYDLGDNLAEVFLTFTIYVTPFIFAYLAIITFCEMYDPINHGDNLFIIDNDDYHRLQTLKTAIAENTAIDSLITYPDPITRETSTHHAYQYVADIHEAHQAYGEKVRHLPANFRVKKINHYARLGFWQQIENAVNEQQHQPVSQPSHNV